MSIHHLVLPLGLCLAFAASAHGESDTPSDETVQIIRNAKAAIALVARTSASGYGTAFCIHPSGLFVTSRDVAGGDIGREIELILNPDQPALRKIPARIVRTDGPMDLTPLQAEGDDFAFLPLGDSGNLIETARVIAVGFPKGRLVVDTNPYPSPTITTARINSLRHVDGRLQKIIVGVERGTGTNTYGIGGPLLDARGLVIGVMGDASQARFARPVADLKQLLATPLVAISTFSVDDAESRQPRQYAVTVLSSQKPTTEWKVELELQSGSAESRRFAAQRGEDGVYRATAALLAPTPPTEVRIHAVFQDGAIRGRVKEQKVQIGNEAVWLHQVRQMELVPAGESSIIDVDGKKLKGRLKGLEEVIVDLGETPLTLNLGRAQQITVESVSGSLTEAKYRIVVRENETIVGETAGLVTIKPQAPTHADALYVENRTIVRQNTEAEPKAESAIAAESAKPVKPFRSILELTQKTPANWKFVEARVGTPLWSDQKVSLGSLPREVLGGTMILHDTGHVGWLPAGAVRAAKDCTVFAIIRTQDHEKIELDEVMIAKFVREGWDELDGDVATDGDGDSQWHWKVFHKQVDAGDVFLQLQTINFGRRCVKFIFQDGMPVKSTVQDAGKPRLPKNAFRSEVIELTDKASNDWLLKEARVGTPVWSDKGYAIAKLPKEIVGGTLVWRDSGSQPRSAGSNAKGIRSKDWLPAGTVKALKDCQMYAIVRWKYLEKVEIDEATFEKLSREGWSDVGDVQTTFPEGEDWRWKAFVKSVPQGEVLPQLNTVSFSNSAMLFVFK